MHNYALVGAAGFLVLVAGALSQLVLPGLRPQPAIGLGLLAAAVGSAGVVAGAVAADWVWLVGLRSLEGLRAPAPGQAAVAAGRAAEGH